MKFVRAKEGNDLSDHVAAGYVLLDLEPVDIAELLCPAAATQTVAGGVAGPNHTREPPDGEATERRSAATEIAEMALAFYDIGISADGEPFAVAKSGPRLVRMLRGGKGSLRAELAKRYRNERGRVASQQALADALLVLEGEAGETEPVELGVRVIEHAGSSWLDLGDATGRAIRINGTGWEVVDAPPVLFRRTALTAGLPEPERGGDLSELWDLVNVTPEDHPTVAAWLVSLLSPKVPHPVVALLGEQGTGKSTAAKLFGSIIDPSPAPLRKPPRDADTWVTAALGSLVVVIDNVSEISPWLSDMLCRAVTGEGDVRRRLYTDGDLAVFAFQRCVVLTGIDFGAVRGDLEDRLLTVQLQRIDEPHRRELSDMDRAWMETRQRILGAVLDLTVEVMAILPTVRLASAPRMADFARILAGVDQVLGTEGLERYSSQAEILAAGSLAADPFVTALRAQITTTFTGTAATLLARVTHNERRQPKGWPGSARAVTGLLRRQGPLMRRVGWTVTELGANNQDGVTKWEVTPPEMVPTPSPLPPLTRPVVPIDGSTGNAGKEYGPSQEAASPAPLDRGVGRPLCSVCGKPNLYHPDSIRLGLCARCARSVERRVS